MSDTRSGHSLTVVVVVFLVAGGAVAFTGVFGATANGQSGASPISEEEPNGNLTTAMTITDGDNVTGIVGGNETTDTFAIEVQKGETITTRFSAPEGEITPRLMGPGGEEIDFISAVGFNVVGHLNTTANRSGTYYIEVLGETAMGPSGQYFVEVNVSGESETTTTTSTETTMSTPKPATTTTSVETTTDTTTTETTTTTEAQAGGNTPSVGEPNDNRENAIPLSFESTPVEGITEAVVSSSDNQSGPARFGPGDEEDWYSFEVEAGQAIRAWGSGGIAHAFEGDLISPDGEVLANLTLSDDNHPNGVVAEESGTYYIHMVNNTFEPVQYSLTVQVAEESQLEPNDDRDSATSFTPGAQVNTTLANGSETDWYVVEADDGGTINATLSALSYTAGGPPIDTHISVDVFDSDGERISKAVDLPNEYGAAENTTGPYFGRTTVATVAEPVDGGTYYVRVSGAETHLEFRYGFSPYALTISGNGLEELGGDDGNVTTPDDGNVTPEDGADGDDDGATQGDELGQNDADDDGDGHVDEDDEDNDDAPSNDDDDGDGAIDEDDEPDDGDDGSDDFDGNAEDDDDGDGHYDEDDEEDGGNSDDEDNDGDGAVDEDDEPDTDD